MQPDQTSVLARIRRHHGELAAAQKPGHGVPFYMRVVNRRLGRVVASVAAVTRATPDTLTFISAVLAFASMVLVVLVPPGPVMALVAVLLAQAAFAFDSADGQLARLRRSGSIQGEWTDHIVDAARIPMFHLAIAVAAIVHDLGGNESISRAWALVALAFAMVTSVRFVAQLLADQMIRVRTIQEPGSSAPASASSGSGRVIGWLQNAADTGVQNLLLILWPWSALFWPVYALFAAINAALLFATLIRRRRALGALR